jgi:hypothetical protein
MAAYARSELIDESSVGMYHCINRCVRRSYLCGRDSVSGRNFDHRKVWLKNRLNVLAQIFAIEIASFAAMDNHLHLVLINRPDYVSTWGDGELIERWWKLFPRKGLKNIPEEIRAMWLADEWFIKKIRQRLSSISWFMRCLCEPLARIANHEDKVSGRFWEGRFKSIKILDQQAALETGIYVDLNPIRAGMADSVETSAHTSIEERVRAITFNTPLVLVKPVRDILKVFSTEEPIFLEGEKEYIAIVRRRAKEVLSDKAKSAAFQAYLTAFPTAIGSASSLRREAKKRGRKWLKGIGKAT